MVWNTLTSHHLPLFVGSEDHTDVARTQDVSLESTEDRLEQFEGLVRQWEPFVFPICQYLHPDAESAEQSCEEAFLALFRGGADLSESTPHFRHLVNFVIETALLDGEQPGESLPVPDRSLCRALARLLPADREVLLLRFVNGLSIPELASLLGDSSASVQRRLWNAMTALTRSGLKFGGDN